jgi:uncharacterized protein DUF1810
MKELTVCNMNDRYDLNRFVFVQSSSYDCVLTELKQGKKISHWMWYIFPQIEGNNSIFERVLTKYYGGKPDDKKSIPLPSRCSASFTRFVCSFCYRCAVTDCGRGVSPVAVGS